MIQAGRLNRKITIQKSTTTVSDSGAPVKTWSTYKSVKAEVLEGANADERMTDFGRLTSETLKLRIRWLDDVRLSDQVLFEGDSYAYRIVKLVELGRRKALELTVTRNNQ